ncbi:hypothetical protein LIER_25675 [Lithospermum erythrorhizon]|uniref:Uncharacterized protein n=1 Tax=Lithospermum erythrorhizon TaxID=34254 RepID=A0AAV3R7Q1_LITER
MYYIISIDPGSFQQHIVGVFGVDHHGLEAIGRVRATLQQSEHMDSRLRHELSELNMHVEDLRRQVTFRESVITSLETEEAESTLKVAYLDEIVEQD